MGSYMKKSAIFAFVVVVGFTVGLCVVMRIDPIEIATQVEFKAKELLLVESQYSNLQKKYYELQHEYFALEERHNALLAKMQSQDEANQNLHLTGSKEGRTIASIEYTVPTGLTMEQKYLLAFSHLREKRFLEAAKTFESFLNVPEGAPYQKAQSFYEAGVAWYEVKNFKKAREYFLAAQDRAEGVEKPQLVRKVELWLKVLDRQRQLASFKEHHKE